MQVFMVICEYEKEVQANQWQNQMDWKVFRKKKDAVNFIRETFEGQPYYEEEVRPDLAQIMERFEPARISGHFNCLELPSWLIGAEDGSWSATISEETLD